MNYFLPFFLLMGNCMSLIRIGGGYVMIVDINMNFMYSDMRIAVHDDLP